MHYIVNADASQLLMLKEKFIKLCQELSSPVVARLMSDIEVVPQQVSYVKFARNDLGVAEKELMINEQGQLTLACNRTYPGELVALREALRLDSEGHSDQHILSPL